MSLGENEGLLTPARSPRCACWLARRCLTAALALSDSLVVIGSGAGEVLGVLTPLCDSPCAPHFPQASVQSPCLPRFVRRSILC